MNRRGLFVRLWLATAALVLVLGTAAGASRRQSAPPLRVLFIGNSYTFYNDLPGTLVRLAASATPPVAVETERVLVGGATLQRHWREGAALEAIHKRRWDYVVLQEQSLLGTNLSEVPLHIAPSENFFEFARLFNAEIRKTSAQTVFYATWARRSRPEFQAKLTDAYRRAARELSALFCPVGIAFVNARILRPELQLFARDGSHPSAAGTYLAAAVFYAVLTGRDPERLASTLVASTTRAQPAAEFMHLPDDEAAFLREVAWRTVEEDPSFEEHTPAAATTASLAR